MEELFGRLAEINQALKYVAEQVSGSSREKRAKASYELTSLACTRRLFQIPGLATIRGLRNQEYLFQQS